MKRDDKQVITFATRRTRSTSSRPKTWSRSHLAIVADADGQMGGLTPQEAADLLEYLVTRK